MTPDLANTVWVGPPRPPMLAKTRAEGAFTLGLQGKGRESSSVRASESRSQRKGCPWPLWLRQRDVPAARLKPGRKGLYRCILPPSSLLPMRSMGAIHPEAGGKEPLLMQAQSRVGQTENTCDSALWCALRVQGAADTKQASRSPVLECKSVTPGERDED